MNDIQVKVAIGGMLHDIGKVLYRYNDGRNHSVSGFEFLRENGIEDTDILEQVKYHHSSLLQDANIRKDSLAYITYWADNVAAGADRRDKDDNAAHRYDKFIPIESVFNVLNNNNEKYTYRMARVFDNGEINYPTEAVGQYSEETYGKIVSMLKSGIKQIELKDAYVNSLLSVMEANLSFIPSSTDTAQLADISLFDHMKITAAVGSCIYEYLVENDVSDYEEALKENAKEYYAKNCFILFSMDISGIQDFIYSVGSEGALKSLRAKSFYLEIMLEHIIDELLAQVGVSRANLIYSGGGHVYLILPNTRKAVDTVGKFETELNNWFIENFGIELYVACGYCQCSANDLKNIPNGSYKKLFVGVSDELSHKKAHRYTAAQIITLNSKNVGGSERECKVCGRVDELTENDICSFCDGFRKLSDGILNEPFVTVLSAKPGKGTSVKMPFDCYMVMENADELKEHLTADGTYLRSYSKNKMFTGYNMATKLWVGDYCSDSSFEKLAEKAEGVHRLGVLRADIDNLGHAFVSGFERKKDGKQYVSISRTATFSRKLNMFFKLHINYLLGSGKFSLEGKAKSYPMRSALVVYSGGDDLFIVGAWNEIIEAAVDINDALEKYTQGTLSISAGVGIFPMKYPVKAMARQTGELEEASKSLDGKNAITLFDVDTGTYKWEEFRKRIVGEKFALINDYFSMTPDKGMSSIYKLMEYIRHLDDRINLARLAYMLGRMEPDKYASDETWQLYRRFSKQLYQWVSGENKEKDRRELIMAIYLYVYLNRGKEGENGEVK